MVIMAHTCRDKYNFLCKKQVIDGVDAPTMSKVGELEKILPTRKRHVHGSTFRTIFAYGSKERENCIYMQRCHLIAVECQHRYLFLVQMSQGGTLIMQVRLRVSKVYLLLQSM